MYRTIYPELQNASVPSSCWRCSVVSLSGEVFGSEKSRHKRSSYVMAYWNKPGGNILNEVGEGELTPGIIEKFIVHNLIVGDENNIHLLAKIRWMIPDANRPRHYCGEPVEVGVPTCMKRMGHLLTCLSREFSVDTYGQMGIFQANLWLCVSSE
ncbi:unnamed protein product [Mytilus edulis]|uniref:Uncharacterized protein n=1 Tax=Mytilus edulis TaxID=6550 RepID=A0A8S3VJX0_MYTED|nr:unnamed protein product [Mytilus edulis]